MSSAGIDTLRRWLLGVLALGLTGTTTELVLMEHYEEPWQWVPLVLVACAIAALGWRAQRRDATSLRVLQTVMGLFLLAGCLGVGLHLRGAIEFQRELDPEIGRVDLLNKVLRVKAPPVLAPGVMLQLGLIGLAYAFAESRREA